jgi:hypothetical protein
VDAADAECIDGQDEAARRWIAEALRAEVDGRSPAKLCRVFAVTSDL